MSAGRRGSRCRDLQKTETMRMISFFQAGLKLSAHWTTELRIAAPEGWGGDPYPEIEDVHSSRIEHYESLLMASLHF